jgi:flagellar FliL protein
MAEEDKTDDTQEEGGKKRGGGIFKILAIVFGLIIVIAVSVGATLYLTGFFDVEKEQTSTEVIEELENTMLDENGEPIADIGPEKQVKEYPDPQKFEQSYQDFKAKFTVNVPNSKKYVQFSLSIMTFYDERVLSNVDKHETALRSAVISLVSLEPIETYQSVDGMDGLRLRIRDALNKVLMKFEDFGGIEEVYFTEFVIQ